MRTCTIYAFDDVYTGVDAYSIPTEKLEMLQDSLRILSGFVWRVKTVGFNSGIPIEMGTEITVGEKNL
jgi:cytoplasmic iron level regulating protein YaaA (DUF328/UPF0246 family)